MRLDKPVMTVRGSRMRQTHGMSGAYTSAALRSAAITRSIGLCLNQGTDQHHDGAGIRSLSSKRQSGYRSEQERGWLGWRRPCERLGHRGWLLGIEERSRGAEERFPAAAYIREEKPLGKASKRLASPTSARTVVYRVCKNHYFFCLLNRLANRRRLTTSKI